MRIAELSRRSGVPVPTIKYYLREGLLPSGEFSSPNQASYAESHVRRLQLVRALLEIGRLPIATIKEILSDLDQPDPDLHCALGRALTTVSGGADSADEAALGDVDDLITKQGWLVSPEAPARRVLADVIAAMRRLGHEAPIARLEDYAAAARRIAEIDLEITSAERDPEDIVYSALVGTVLGGAMISALRHLAQEDASARVYGYRGP